MAITLDVQGTLSAWAWTVLDSENPRKILAEGIAETEELAQEAGAKAATSETTRKAAVRAAESQRFVLFNRSGQAVALAEAPSLLDARLYAARDTHGHYGGDVQTEESFCRSHGALVESWRQMFEAEGRDEPTATALAHTAAGMDPVAALPRITVPYQQPDPRFMRKTTMQRDFSTGRLALKG